MYMIETVILQKYKYVIKNDTLANIVPMAYNANHDQNNGFLGVETTIQKALDEGKEVKAAVKVYYPQNDSTKRPSGFRYIYWINGKRRAVDITNI